MYMKKICFQGEDICMGIWMSAIGPTLLKVFLLFPMPSMLLADQDCFTIDSTGFKVAVLCYVLS